jgi:O-antigen ligase
LRLGLFKTHPITVADICALTFLLGLGRKGKWVWLAQAVALCCTVATVSRGSIAALTAILIMRFLWLSRLRTSVPVLGVLVVAIATAFIAGYRADELARFLPRQVTAAYQASADDPELDGRVPLWAYAITIMNDHLPFGFGFDGARMRLMNRFDWAGHSHNSFLETWLISGPVGLIAFMAGWIITIVRNSRQPAGRLFLPVHAYLAITSFIGPATTGNAGPGLLLLALAAMAPRPILESVPAPNLGMRNLVYFPERIQPAPAPLRSAFPASD